MKRAMICAGLTLVFGIAGLDLLASPAQAQRYIARCAATPWCRITCTSNVTTVACYAVIRPNGRCFKRCYRAR